MSVFSFGKRFFEKNPNLIRICSLLYNRIFGRNRFSVRGNGNRIAISCSFLKKSKIIIRGDGNKIIFGDRCYLENTVIAIYGDNNTVSLGDMVFVNKGDFYFEDSYGQILIGDRTTISGHTHLACIEGKTIAVGDNCLFSDDVTVRVGDSHSILDMDGRRINPSQDILIGNHVWFGNKTILTKGAGVADDSIVGTGSVVTKAFAKSNVVIAGVPAKIIKEEVNWDIRRI